MARFVLALLLLFSLLSWAIILYKGLALHRATAHTGTFLEIFRKSSKFSEVTRSARSSRRARSWASSRPATSR